jgi:two-component system response regulator YesN
VTEVAFEVGFQDSGYFARVFKKEVGVGPREFRRRL